MGVLIKQTNRVFIEPMQATVTRKERQAGVFLLTFLDQSLEVRYKVPSPSGSCHSPHLGQVFRYAFGKKGFADPAIFSKPSVATAK